MPAAQPAGPDVPLLTTDGEQPTVEPPGQHAHRLLRPLPFGHQREVVGVEVISELGVIDQFTGEQALDALATPLRGAAGPVPGLAGVLGADGGQHAIAERRLRAEQATQGRARDFGTLRLFDEEVPEEGVAGEVATQDGVEGNAVARIQTSLCEQNRRNGRGAALAHLEHGKPVLDGGGEGGVEALEVGGVGDVVGIGDRVDAGRDRGLDLGQALTEARGNRRAGLVQRAHRCRCPARPPCDRGETRAVSEWVQGALCHAFTLVSEWTASNSGTPA